MLEQSAQVSRRELAGAIELSVSCTNYVLRALIEKGWVKAEKFSQSLNKLGHLYHLLSSAALDGIMKLTWRFLMRKQQEYDVLMSEIAELEQELFRNVPGDPFGKVYLG